MSESTSAAVQDDNVEDCPLCLEPLPPFWNTERRVKFICCGKATCIDCMDKRNAVLQRAVAEGSVGRQEEQLARTCPLCRTPLTTPDNEGRGMVERFEKGELPLNLYQLLGEQFVDGRAGVERNVERAIEILMLGANKGDPNCRCWLGDRYRKGTDGLPKCPEEAKKWYLAATQQGQAIAEYNLAIMMSDEGNYAEYLRYMIGSASKGFDGACYDLGSAYFAGGFGLGKSTKEAIRVLQPAAERGNVACMGLLGLIVCSRDDRWHIDSPNFTRGVHWLRRAAEAGDQTAISHLKELEEYASTECFGCDKKASPEKAFLRCSRCRAAWYCSKDCQVQHWKAKEGGHKQRCIKWA